MGPRVSRSSGRAAGLALAALPAADASNHAKISDTGDITIDCPDVDASPAEFWDLDDDLPLFVDADILAGRSGVRVRVVAVVDAATPEDRIMTLAVTDMVARARRATNPPSEASTVATGRVAARIRYSDVE